MASNAARAPSPSCSSWEAVLALRQHRHLFMINASAGSPAAHQACTQAVPSGPCIRPLAWPQPEGPGIHGGPQWQSAQGSPPVPTRPLSRQQQPVHPALHCPAPSSAAPAPGIHSTRFVLLQMFQGQCHAHMDLVVGHLVSGSPANLHAIFLTCACCCSLGWLTA